MLIMEQFNHTLYIIGGASTALEMRETINLIDNPYDCIVNVVANGESCRYSFIEDSKLIDHLAISNKKSFIIGFINQKLRKKFYDLLVANNAQPADNIIHPRAFIAKSAKLGRGNYLACNAVVSSEAELDDFNIINLNVTVGHNAKIGSNCIFNPGARISGNCNIGDRCLFGANSFVFQGNSVCDDCSIDALTYVNQNLEEPVICTSNTGTFKKYRNRLK